MDIIHIPADVNRVTCVSEEQVQGIYNRPEFLSARFQYSGNHYWQLQFIFCDPGGFPKVSGKPWQALKKVHSNRPQVLIRVCFLLISPFLLEVFLLWYLLAYCYSEHARNSHTKQIIQPVWTHVFWQESLLGQSQSRPFSFSSNNEKKKKNPCPQKQSVLCKYTIAGSKKLSNSLIPLIV